MIKRCLLALLLSSVLAGCSTVTIHPKQHFKYSDYPSYQETLDFYLWGLVGEERINVKSICKDKDVLQMQSQATAKNVLFTILTLGIYAPHSVKVWCSQ